LKKLLPQMDDNNSDTPIQVILPVEEFADDLDNRLGRANGNIFHRREGIEGVHDGQYMVRLKKKRFIVIDYSILPTEVDIQAANQTPHVSCPPGAGKQKCGTPGCHKVGVPVLLYDSEPNEPSSLYLRAGLCFTCQRNLNEKRRTQRKRPSDAAKPGVLYAVGPGQKKVKLNGDTVELESDAIILNGPPSGDVKTVRDGNGFHEIGIDLAAAVRQAKQETDILLNSISGSDNNDANNNNANSSGTAHLENNNNGTTDTTTTATTTDIAAAVAAGVNSDATNAAVDAATPILNGDHHPPPTADITGLYDKAFHSLSKSIYLLTQWKQSWDSAVAAAVAQETAGDPSLADAVASAAAVVAAAADGQDSNSQTMVSLLLAAKDGEKQQQENAVETVVQSFEV
jgi:hypothetical protein